MKRCSSQTKTSEIDAMNDKQRVTIDDLPEFDVTPYLGSEEAIDVAARV